MARGRAPKVGVARAYLPDWTRTSTATVAQFFGVSVQLVGQWRKLGCPCNAGRPVSFDLAQVTAWRLARAAETGRSSSGSGEGEPGGVGIPDGHRSWREMQEAEKAKKAQMEREVLEGKLVLASEVKAQQIQKLVALVNAHDHVAHVMPPVLEGKTAREIEGLLVRKFLEIRVAWGEGVEG